MIGYAERVVISETLNLNSGATKEYVFSDLKYIYVYGYSHILQDGVVSVIVKNNDDNNSVYLVGSNSSCIIPVSVVKSDTGIKIIIKANQALNNVSFTLVFYYALV